MGTFSTSTKKAQEAGSSVMKEFHEAKQKGVPKWLKLMNSKNPDCYILDQKIVVRLDKVKDEEAAKTAAGEYGDIIEDKSGNYYGVICAM